MKNILYEINAIMIMQKFNEFSLGFSMLKWNYKAGVKTILWLYITIRISLRVETDN
jgi:hypothetical protein